MDASGSSTVLLFTRATGYVHESIPTAAEVIGEALRARGLLAVTSADATSFTADGLARYAGVVLISTTGTPLGEPGTEPQSALAAFVRAGGALVGIHAASSADYEEGTTYARLLGGRFVDHPGGVRPAACHAVAPHPAVAGLPVPFMVRDEIYVMKYLHPGNTVVLTCDPLGGGPALPIAWHRDEGHGRVFYTALGHDAVDWTPDGPLVAQHIVPAILWTLRR